MANTPQADLLTEPPESLDEPSDHPVEEPDRVAEPVDDSAVEPDRLSRQSEWSNWTVLAMIVLCFFVIVRFRPFASRRPQHHAAVGKTLSELELEPLTGEGRRVTLADLTGRVVLINFWGPWSSPGRDGLPPLAEMSTKFQDQPAFKLLAVSCGEHANQDPRVLRRDTEEFLRRQNLRIPVYADPGEVTRSAIDDVVGFHDYPTTLIIDRAGRIRGVWVGYKPGVEDDMQQLVVRLLAEG